MDAPPYRIYEMVAGKKYLRFIDEVQVAFCRIIVNKYHRKVMVAKYVRQEDNWFIFDLGRKLVYCNGGEFREIE